MNAASLPRLAAEAWQQHDAFAGSGIVVAPSIPILFFGDLAAYAASALRVVTVGLNPSRLEFPTEAPFRRFPEAADGRGRNAAGLIATLNAYYDEQPYRRWFNAYEPMLQGLATSYYAGGRSRALHTDICSPLATDPTWSKLDRRRREALQAAGTPLWHRLLEVLRPEVVLASVAVEYRDQIAFPAEGEWQTLDEVATTQSGAVRAEPYVILGRRYRIGDTRPLAVWGRAANTPFGTIASTQKRELGRRIRECVDAG